MSGGAGGVEVPVGPDVEVDAVDALALQRGEAGLDLGVAAVVLVPTHPGADHVQAFGLACEKNNRTRVCRSWKVAFLSASLNENPNALKFFSPSDLLMVLLALHCIQRPRIFGKHEIDLEMASLFLRRSCSVFLIDFEGTSNLVKNLTAGVIPVAAGLLGATRRTETGLRVLGVGLAAAELHAFSVGAEAVAVLAADIGGKA